MANLKATRSKQLFMKQTVPAVSPQAVDLNSLKTYTCMLRGTGPCTATILLEGSALPDDDSFATVVTISMTTSDGVAAPAKDYGTCDAPWSYTRFTLVSISGTNASVDAAVGA